MTGLRAALAAGMKVVAVANPFSKPHLQQQQLLPQEAVVYDPKLLDNVIRKQCQALHEESSRKSH